MIKTRLHIDHLGQWLNKTKGNQTSLTIIYKIMSCLKILKILLSFWVSCKELFWGGVGYPEGHTILLLINGSSLDGGGGVEGLEPGRKGAGE
ncbi:hypothetical protein ACROYT_G044767 [Oculina patagonica]